MKGMNWDKDKPISVLHDLDENVSNFLQNNVGEVEVGECRNEQDVVNSDKFKKSIEIILNSCEGFDKDYIFNLVERVNNNEFISEYEYNVLNQFLDINKSNGKRIFSLLKVISKRGGNIKNQEKLIQNSITSFETKIKNYENIFSGKIIYRRLTQESNYYVVFMNGKFNLYYQDINSNQADLIIEFDDFQEFDDQEHIWYIKNYGKWGVFDMYAGQFLIGQHYDDIDLAYSVDIENTSSYINGIGWGKRDINGKSKNFLLYQDDEGYILELEDSNGELFVTDYEICNNFDEDLRFNLTYTGENFEVNGVAQIIDNKVYIKLDPQYLYDKYIDDVDLSNYKEKFWINCLPFNDKGYALFYVYGPDFEIEKKGILNDYKGIENIEILLQPSYYDIELSSLSGNPYVKASYFKDNIEKIDLLKVNDSGAGKNITIEVDGNQETYKEYSVEGYDEDNNLNIGNYILKSKNGKISKKGLFYKGKNGLVEVLSMKLGQDIVCIDGVTGIFDVKFLGIKERGIIAYYNGTYKTTL